MGLGLKRGARVFVTRRKCITMSDTETRSGRTSEHSSNPACDQCRARKVRCDRRRPECSNCSKAGVCCDFTNQSKRVNHIKQLWVVGHTHARGSETNGNNARLNDFSSVTSRLESIEAALGNLSHQLVTIKRPGSSSCPSRSGSRSSSVSGRETVRDFLEEFQTQELEDVNEDPAEFVHQGDACCGCEQFFGVTSDHSLFKSAKERTANIKSRQPGRRKIASVSLHERATDHSI